MLGGGMRSRTSHARLVQTVVVPSASGRGVSADVVARARALLVFYLGESRRLRVVDLDRPPEPWPRTGPDRAELARHFRAATAIWIDLAHAGAGAPTEVVIGCTDRDGNATCEIRETVPHGPEMLPAVLAHMTERLLVALDPTWSFTPHASLTLATKRAAAPARAARLFSFGATTEVFVPLAAPVKQPRTLGGVGVFISLDGDAWLAEASLRYAAAGSDQHIYGAGLDLLLPFSGAEHVPYVGAGLAAISQNLGGRGARGLQGRPSLGLLWGRHGLRLRVEASYFVDVFTEQELDRLVPGSDRQHRAHGLLFSAGAAF
jgi:hypothetical protein